MLNIILTESRIIAFQQKKTGAGSQTQKLGVVLRTEDEALGDTMGRLRAQLAEAGCNEKKAAVVLTSDVVFKEFSHKPVSEKAVLDFARLEARTVLREEAPRYSVTYLDYGSWMNDKGEETGMLLATPYTLLEEVKKACAAGGFTVVSVQSELNCYVAALNAVLPEVAADFTGAAIDYGLDDTLLAVYNQGDLISLRRLQGLASALAPIVQAETGCAPGEESESLYIATEHSDEFYRQAATALENYNYDVLRAVRVVTSPMHIDVQNFLLSGEICSAPVLQESIEQTLALPCVFLTEELSAVEEKLAQQNAVGSVVPAGVQYVGNFNLMSEGKKREFAHLMNVTTCAIITGVVLVGMLVWPVSLALQRVDLAATQQRYDQLQSVQAKLDELTNANVKNSNITRKIDELLDYTSNTAQTLKSTLALFGDGLTIDSVAFDGGAGSYTVVFYAVNEQTFTALKNKIYQNEEYFLDLQLTSTLQMNEGDEFPGTYCCTLYFIPYDQKQLPASVVDETDEVTQETDTTTELLESATGGVA